MRYQFEQCLERGKIVKIEIAPDIISKEINEAKNSEDSALELRNSASKIYEVSKKLIL